MKNIEVFCPFCTEKAMEVDEQTLEGGFRVSCTHCGGSIHLEDGNLPESRDSSGNTFKNCSFIGISESISTCKSPMQLEVR